MVKKNYAVFINLGTPSDTRLFTIQKYLFEFLFDPCVIDMPFFSRLLLVGGLIVPTRSFSTRRSYQKIFTPEGSPLMVYSRRLVDTINDIWKKEKSSQSLEALLAMRYGEPSLKKVFNRFAKEMDRGYRIQVVFIPLYPQAALSTTGTVERKIQALIKTKIKRKKLSSLNYQIAPPFYKEKEYLDILSDSLRFHLEREYDHILFSYHGIPERHLTKFDPHHHCLSHKECCDPSRPVESHSLCYRHQVFVTTEALVKRLNLRSDQYTISFQSRLGKSPWLTPYTDQTVIELAKGGVKQLLVACPAFVSDNLETLFEIEIENRKIFQEYGGKKLTLIPCLNDRPEWIDYLKRYATRYLDV